LNTPRPTLAWRDTSDASNYHVQIDDVSNFSSPAVNDSIGNADTTYAVADSLPERLWYWRVRAGSGSLWSDYCATQTFRVDLRGPNTTTLLTPAAGSFTADRTPYFSWSAVADLGGSGVLRYFIQVDNDSLFGAPQLLNDSTVYVNYTSTSNLPANSRLFWRVRARDNAGNFAVWATGFFTIDNTAPAGPIGFNITPDGWSGNPTFTLTWANPADPSGISMSLFKIGSAPTSNYDSTGHFGASSPAIYGAATTGTYVLYLWLVDGVGNASYVTAARDTLRFDNTPPSSGAASSPEISASTDFNVSWGGGTDVGSGLAGLYDVRSMDSVAGVWTDWRSLAPAGEAVFAGQHGHVYYFEARTYDLVGNTEPFTGLPETYTRIDTTFTGPDFLPGDANANDQVNGLDVIYLVAYLKGGPPPPEPFLRGDANGNCQVNGLDVIYLVSFLKGVGAPPYAGDCGP
jgi:hypothetical protein